MPHTHTEFLVVISFALLIATAALLALGRWVSKSKANRKVAQLVEERRANEELPGQFSYLKDVLNKRIATLTPEEQKAILLPIRDAELSIKMCAARQDQIGYFDAHTSGINAVRAAIALQVAKNAKTTGAA